LQNWYFLLLVSLQSKSRNFIKKIPARSFKNSDTLCRISFCKEHWSTASAELNNTEWFNAIFGQNLFWSARSGKICVKSQVDAKFSSSKAQFHYETPRESSNLIQTPPATTRKPKQKF
jgi:hypothetical protein